MLALLSGHESPFVNKDYSKEGRGTRELIRKASEFGMLLKGNMSQTKRLSGLEL